MSIDYSVYMGPYAVCSGPRRGCLPAVDEWLQEHDERLYEAGAHCVNRIAAPSHIFIPNGWRDCDYTLICPTEDEPALYSVPRMDDAVTEFAGAFVPELEMLRDKFTEVSIDFGLMHWAS